MCLFRRLELDLQDLKCIILSKSFKIKSGFCVWCDRTPRGAAYVSQFHWESGRRSSPLSGSDLKGGFVVLEMRKAQCCTSYTRGEMCSIWSRFPVILVVSCTRFDRGSQLYSWWAVNVRLTKPTAPMSFDKPYLRGFHCLPIRRLTSPTALNLNEDVAWLGTWARSCVVPDFSQRCLHLKMWDLSQNCYSNMWDLVTICTGSKGRCSKVCF